MKRADILSAKLSVKGIIFDKCGYLDICDDLLLLTINITQMYRVQY